MSELMAGAAKTDITPDSPVMLEGNPRDHKSEGVHDPISARALFLDGGDEPVLLMSLELCAFAPSVAQRIRSEIHQTAGIAPERQVLACCHIHSGPATLGFFCPVEEEYIALLLPRLSALVAEAREKAAPVRVGCGRGEEYTISEYRRLWTKDDRIVMNWDHFSWDDILGPAGIPDPEVGVVRINSATDGSTIAVIYNHAGHPNTPPGDWFEVSGDYPAFASAMIENDLGGVALFTNGAQGSVDIPAFRERDWDGLARKGTWLGRVVLDVAGDIRTESDAFEFTRVTFSVPKREIEPDYLEWARRTAAAKPDHELNLPDGIDDSMYAKLCLKLADESPEDSQLEMSGLRIGDAAFVTVPGEAFTEIGRAIKSRSPFPHTYIVGIVNEYCGYFPTYRAICEGGYTTRPGVSRFSVHADSILTDQAVAILKTLSARAET